jgi:hypothetical protein
MKSKLLHELTYLFPMQLLLFQLLQEFLLLGLNILHELTHLCPVQLLLFQLLQVYLLLGLNILHEVDLPVPCAASPAPAAAGVPPSGPQYTP